jgi:transcriptional regulator with XRE-family HTH domain
MAQPDQDRIIGQNIRRFREEMMLSQEALARRADLSSKSVIRYESGKHASTDALNKLAKALERPMTDFYSEEPPAKPQAPRAVAFKILVPLTPELERRIERFEASINREFLEEVFQAQEAMHRKTRKR